MTNEILQKALVLAETWQNKASEKKTEFEESFHEKMKKLLDNPIDKVFLIALMDQSFRSRDVYRVKDQIDYLFSKYGMATFFTDAERFLIFLFRHAGAYIPKISIPLFVDNIRNDTNSVVLPGDDKSLNKHLQLRKKSNVRVNVNLIGEVVMGEDEAEMRMQKYLKSLENPNIDYLSIKISTVYSQLSSMAHEQTVEEIVSRLSRIYRQAIKYSFNNEKGLSEAKFVNLDMEEYKDLSLTIHAFMKTLEKEEFKKLTAGIVLQAYLPDSHLWQKKLTDWAKARVANGGAPIKVRLVKGANMEMEQTEASLRNWKQAPYASKVDTDSNYKVMAEYALQPENIKAVKLGLASHNIFELAYGYELAKQNQVLEDFSIEMLEGMSEAARKAITEISAQKVILYAPTAEKEQFTNAIAYLVRRLDENTNEDNFMRYSFGLEVGSSNWEKLKQKFIKSFEQRTTVFIGQKRRQNRLYEVWEVNEESCFYTGKYRSEPDTDFILEANQIWANQIVSQWKKKKNDNIDTIPVVVDGEEIYTKQVKEVVDKSQFEQEIYCGRYSIADKELLEKSVRCAADDKDSWRLLDSKERHLILSQVAVEIRRNRSRLIGVAAAEVGKVFTETDVEVSEAVDFCEYYGHATRWLRRYHNIEFSGKGVGLVVPPWNFPIAIPCGGIAAALAAGNTVILKPASHAVLSAYELAKCFWQAGVSKKVLQFVPCPGQLAGEHLVKNPAVDFVILTGGESTAFSMLETRPSLSLSAETGGKDATIVTTMADREQAIYNVVHSAFMNSGQKCSATSLLVLENELYYDQKFKESLVDAAKSIEVGSVWNLKNKIGTLVDKPDGVLKKAIEELDEGESWVLKPEIKSANPYCITPGIKYGVKEGSFSHKTEFFGPVLSVMRADNLKHAVKIVNQTGYGLTSGIESLDEREVNYWRENIKAGNLYINRGTTGAIVLRQPFGGMGKSAIGAGRKVGVHNYITQFINIKEVRSPSVSSKYNHAFEKMIRLWLENESLVEFHEQFNKLYDCVQSYLYNYEEEFSKTHDFFKLRGEDNIFRYLPLNKILVRVGQQDSLFDTLSRVFAAKISGVSVDVSLDPSTDVKVFEFLFQQASKILDVSEEIKTENETTFEKRIKDYDRIIFSGSYKVNDRVYLTAHNHFVHIVTTPALMEGRFELLNYFVEQSVSHSYHRYGNLGERALM